jgi:hypothetical protein
MSNMYSRDYLTGINDWFLYRNHAPKWMNVKEKIEWLKGYNHARFNTIYLRS